MGDKQSGVSGLASWRQLFKLKNFGWLWAGQVISQVGDGVTKVALLWFVYNLTGSALKMTIIGVLQTVPPLVLGPFAGVVLDRVHKRTAMILMDVIRAGLLVLIPVLYLMGLLTLAWLYAIVFLIALFGMAYGPALNAAIPMIVKQEQLTSANAVMQSSMTIGQLLGPAISGLLIAIIGAQNVLYVNAAAFIVSALCKLPVRIDEKELKHQAALSGKVVWHDLREGFRFVFFERRLLFFLMIGAALFTMGATGFVFMLPVIGERMLHTSSVELGWLWSSLSVGILMATVWLTLKKQTDICPRFWLMAGSALFGGAAVLAVGWTSSLVLAAVFIAVIGASSGVVTPIVSASLQQLTPQDLLARVFGVFNTGTMGLAMLGMIVFGWAADRFGPLVSVIAVGSVKLFTACVLVFLIPSCGKLAEHAKKAAA